MITGWTSWHFDSCSEGGYTEFSNAIQSLKKRAPGILTKDVFDNKTDEEIEKLCKEQSALWEEYDKNPWLDGKKEEGEALQRYREKCCNDLIEYCILHRIYISPEEHQNSDWGVPIFDNKYVDQFSLRSWAGIMSEVWNKILETDELDYLSFYCSDADNVIKDYKKPIDELKE